MRCAFAMLLLGACRDPEPLELLDGAVWQAVPDGHPLATGSCSELAWTVEGGALEVATDGCSPLAIRTSLAGPIEVGDPLEVVWWHGFLTAPEPADGNFQLFVDGQPLFEAIEPIPMPPAAYTDAFEADVGGDELVLRVQNHGANTWNLLRLTRL